MFKVLTRLGYRQKDLGNLELDQLGGPPRLRILIGRSHRKRNNKPTRTNKYKRDNKRTLNKTRPMLLARS